MKICILSAFEDSIERKSGASVRIYNLAKGLADLRNEVIVVMPARYPVSHHVDGFNAFWFKGIYPLAFLKISKRIVEATRPTLLYFYDFIFIARISRLLKTADVIQIEQHSIQGLLIPFYRLVLKRPVVVDCHDVFQALRLKHTGFLRKALETFQEKLAYKYADLLLTVSESEKQCLISYGVSSSKIGVIPNGVDTKKFANLPPKNPEILKEFGLTGLPVVIFVGNNAYLPNRQAVQLISTKIAPLVSNYIPAAKFLIVGASPNSIRLPNLTFTGVVKDVLDFLALSDVAVAPLYSGTGTKLKILEYLSCGLPVVSTKLGAEGICVTDGKNIYLEDDPTQFAERVVKLLRDKQLSKQMGEEAMLLAKKEYDWVPLTQSLNNLLVDSLNSFLKKQTCKHPSIGEAQA